MNEPNQPLPLFIEITEQNSFSQEKKSIINSHQISQIFDNGKSGAIIYVGNNTPIFVTDTYDSLISRLLAKTGPRTASQISSGFDEVVIPKNNPGHFLFTPLVSGVFNIEINGTLYKNLTLNHNQGYTLSDILNLHNEGENNGKKDPSNDIT